MIPAILGVLAPILGDVVKKVFPNPEHELKRLEVQNQLQIALLSQTAELEKAAASIVKAEAEGQSWMQRNWRPLTMLVFVTLIVARFLGYTAPGISENEYLSLWNLMEIGLGGYVVGRSVEKIAPSIATVLKNK